MFDALVVIEVLGWWSAIFSFALWYVHISCDVYAGRLARVLCMAVLGIVILPLAKLVMPSVTVEILPYALWHWFQWNVNQTVLTLLLALYGIGFFIRIYPMILGYFDTHFALADARVAPQAIQHNLIPLLKKYPQRRPLQIFIADVAGPCSGQIISDKPLGGLVNFHCCWHS